MTVVQRFKAPSAVCRSVAVIASETDLARATKLRRLPDLFELRLDALPSRFAVDDEKLSGLNVPYIVTARAPGEGGLRNLRTAERRELLLKFLPVAAYVDVELRSATKMRPVLEEAQNRGVKRILSVHAFHAAPSAEEMNRWADRARPHSPDVFKIAVRTDTTEELERLLAFFERSRQHLAISAMGIGKLGRRSRIELARRGSALSYAHLGTGQVAGQLSWRDLRRLVGTEVAPSPSAA
jgi:3-dehydroquinate dehydratase type I